MSFRTNSTEESRLRDVLRDLLGDVAELKRLSAATHNESGWVKIAETTLPLDGAFSFDAIPAGYAALKVVGSLRSSFAEVYDQLVVRVNSSVAFDYYYQYLEGHGVTVGAAGGAAVTYTTVGMLYGDSSSVGAFAPVEVIFPQYAGVRRFKLWQCLSAADGWVRHGAGLWDSGVDGAGAPITGIQLQGFDAASLKAGSWAQLLGLV